MVYYNLGLVFVVWVIISICYIIILTTIVAVIQGNACIDTQKSDGSRNIKWASDRTGVENKPASNCVLQTVCKLYQAIPISDYLDIGYYI